MTINKSLVWFRRDLRSFDHAALHYALTSSAQVFCVFVYDKAILEGLPPDDRRVSFIHASIAELDAGLRRMGGQLIALHANAAQAIPALAAELGVDAVFTNHDYEPAAIARDQEVAAQLEADGRVLHSFKDQVVFEKDEVLTLAGKPFTVFTPYKNAWLKRLEAEPETLDPYPVEPHAAQFAKAKAPPLPTLGQLGFTPVDTGVPAGMQGAARMFDAFLERIADYGHARDYPALPGTSQLSVHLRFGTLPIRHLVRTVRKMIGYGGGSGGAPVWLSELIWREFYAMILYRNPHVTERAFKPAYDNVAWEAGPDADQAFAAWCEGRTGYPLVDAAMAQINQTGFMHNRLRMVTASFLVKDLGIDWKWGERYFALKLIDYELSSNNGGWQWAASSGCDAQPFFRIFNPVTQSQRFDPDGEFIRRYVPQLATLDAKQIHAPWLVAREVLEQKGIRLGKDYPGPLVAHDEARRKTLERYAVVKA
ncbi:MAG: cryptochrome/photolyase family protein [Telluria sp.]